MFSYSEFLEEDRYWRLFSLRVNLVVAIRQRATSAYCVILYAFFIILVYYIYLYIY
jgi:hypothetical protein